MRESGQQTGRAGGRREARVLAQAADPKVGDLSEESARPCIQGNSKVNVLLGRTRGP